MRKKRKRYKLVAPTAAEPAIPERVLFLVLVMQWTLWLGLLGVLVPMLLLTSLFTHVRIAPEWWLRLWPVSIRLLTATGLNARQMSHLALLLAGENGLVYALYGILLGGIHGSLRRIFRRRRA